MFGQPGREEGDRLVYTALEKELPDGSIVYAQPELTYGEKRRSPDYIVVSPSWGVVVLEVKDWADILEINKTKAHVKRRNGSTGWETSPVTQAKEAAHTLERILRSNPALVDYYSGGLSFSYAYGGVLPYINAIAWLEEQWGKGYILGMQALKPGCIAK